MPTPGRPATAPARPTPAPTAAASLSARFFYALPHAQNTMYNMMCSLLSHIFPHWSTFKPSRKLPEIKKSCFYSFPKNLFLPSVPCYARPLLSNQMLFWRWLYASSVHVYVTKFMCPSSQNLVFYSGLLPILLHGIATEVSYLGQGCCVFFSTTESLQSSLWL